VKDHTLVVTLRDRPGVLNRAVSMFRRRGYNIASLTVGHAERAGISRMTLVVESQNVEQVAKQLYRLVDVLRVDDVTDASVVEREMMLMRVKAIGPQRAELTALAEAFDCKIVDVDHSTMMLEMTGAPTKVDNLIQVVRPFGVVEMMRTGRITMVRGLSLNRDSAIAYSELPLAAESAPPYKVEAALVNQT
jgi:acetolactate synthase-1/3 small subunit